MLRKFCIRRSLLTASLVLAAAAISLLIGSSAEHSALGHATTAPTTRPTTSRAIPLGNTKPAVHELAGEQMRQMIEADWLAQVKPAPKGRGKPVAANASAPPAVKTSEDAAGAVDGVKNGLYAFHTGHEPKPWWQVDLGAPADIARIVVYNRLDYAPGLHNADTLRILTSHDASTWIQRHDQGGKFFGGAKDRKPLVVEFPDGQLKARYVRLQIPSAQPIFLHLDEVEVYGPGKDAKNIALHKPADQSSLSQWSTSKIKAGSPASPALSPVATGDGIAPLVIGQWIERGRKLAADLQAAGVVIEQTRTALDQLEAKLKSLPADADAATTRGLYFDVRWTIRQLALSNPLLVFDRLAFIKRFTQETYPDVCLNHMPWVSRPGGDLCILESTPGTKLFASLAKPESGKPAASVTHILNGALGFGHVHGMDLWFGGNRMVFGYARKPTDQPIKGFPGRLGHAARLAVEPTHIYEVNLDGTNLRQLTGERIWSDLDPTYTPAGDIVFVSDRCGFSLQCNEMDKDETSCNLYRMNADGDNVRRLSVNKDGDYLPHTLDDGTIAYTRWEYHERGFADLQSIWIIRPDGTMGDALFKQHLANPWAFEDTRSIPNSRKLVSIATGHHTLAMGPVCVLDPAVGMNTSAAIRIVTPGVKPPEGGMSGTPVDEGGVSDAGGFYSTPWALSEKYFLVSYGYGKETDATGYALYLIDVFGNKELIYRDPTISCFLPIPARARKLPPILPTMMDPAKDHAVCTITNVAYGTGVDPDKIKYVRICEPVGWPYDEKHGGFRYEPDAKGQGVGWNPARILGTVPVAPDGSVAFKVPPDTAVYFQLLDENHMEVRRMRSFISFQNGEQRSCNGCHETQAQSFPQSAALKARPATQPTPPPWGQHPVSFLRDVQPILDQQCASCHTGLKPAGKIDLSPGLTTHYNRAYESLVGVGRGAAKYVSVSNKYDSAAVLSLPYAFGSHKSKVIQCLNDANHKDAVKLSREQFITLVSWVDTNANYHDRFINKRPATPHYDLAADKALLAGIQKVHAARCAGCHKPAEVSRLDWINLRNPAASIFLSAPLAKQAGGAGKCKAPAYKDASHPDYQALRKQMEAAVARALAQPRRDVQSLAEQAR